MGCGCKQRNNEQQPAQPAPQTVTINNVPTPVVTAPAAPTPNAQ
jgi:hypothetical protein